MDEMTEIVAYGRRAEGWALQTSTIVGAATIVAAAIGGTADATTGLPVLSALAGLVAGGLAAIFLPGQDPAPVVAGLERVVAALAAREAASGGAKPAATDAEPAIAAAGPVAAAAG